MKERKKVIREMAKEIGWKVKKQDGTWYVQCECCNDWYVRWPEEEHFYKELKTLTSQYRTGLK